MLKYLLAKEELSLPDRNLVRRIIADGFEEELLQGGSKDFVSHIRYGFLDLGWWRAGRGMRWCPNPGSFACCCAGR